MNQQPWHPISSAPKDQYLLLNDPGLKRPVIGIWNAADQAWTDTANQTDIFPVGWLELPSMTPSAQHPDDAAVDGFAAAMKAKLAKAREKGRGGWQDPEQCTAESLRQDLRQHVHKGDPVDVGNFAMFLHARGERTIAPLDPELVAAINAAPADATAIMHNGHPVFLTREGTDLGAILSADDRYRDLRATVQSIKHLAGEIVLQVVDGGEVPQDLESGEEVCVLYEASVQQEDAQ